MKTIFFAESRLNFIKIALRLGTDVGKQIPASVRTLYCGASPNKMFEYLSAGLPMSNDYPGWPGTFFVTSAPLRK